ncbi:MAG: mevalonate kinase [Alkalispirochaetaceae bacterium]
MQRLSAPGNLLLLGEYAVTEAGGVGVALGVAPRAVATVEDAPEPAVESVLGGRSVHWPEEPLELVDALLRELELRGEGVANRRVTVDTRAFHAGSRKLGFGSSAAAAALLAAALSPSREPAERLFDIAVQGHRRFQGGRGSGYDVAASTYGGIIRFTGGERPEVEPVTLPWLPPLYAVRGARAVATKGAIGSYTAWKRSEPREAREFLQRSNELVSRFLAAGSWEEGRAVLVEAQLLGTAVGRSIGVESTFELEGLSGPGAPLVKAVGAGAEMGILFDPEGDVTVVEQHATVLPVEITAEGLTWE